MLHTDFEIGDEFTTATGTWRCTDVGSRTMIAIKISGYDDPSWFNGPPYAVVEHVFDEDALSGFERLADGTLTLGGESPSA
jgi:hypothetical protein|tara:strand:+ start:382 stop:624 length:243 start_codon:yes stop_codon:yes gene_type:complete